MSEFDLMDKVEQRLVDGGNLTPNQEWLKSMTIAAQKHQPMPTSPEELFRWELTVQAEATSNLREKGVISQLQHVAIKKVGEVISDQGSTLAARFAPEYKVGVLEEMSSGMHAVVGKIIDGQKRKK